MDIQTSVGRRQGRNSQNRVIDQEIIQSLLNRIPVAQGGTAGTLHERMVDGICSDRLYEAILTFQRVYMGSRADGHIDPHGPTLASLNRLANATSLHQPAIQVLAATPVSPPMAGQRLSDGGSPVNNEASRRQIAWNNFVNDTRDALRSNPNHSAVMAYLNNLERSAGPNAPGISNFVVFGNAYVNHYSGFHNARIMHRGDWVSSHNDSNIVLLTPPEQGDWGGGLIRLGRHAILMVPGRQAGHVVDALGSSADTTLMNGNLRNNLGRLAGRSSN